MGGVMAIVEFRTHWARLSSLAVLVALLAGFGCATTRQIVLLDEDIPLVAPVEGDFANAAAIDARDDAPARVARLGLITGAVSVRPSGLEGWSIAVPNLPLTSGDELWSDQNGRAALQAGTTGIKAGAATDLSLLKVADGFMQMGLERGSVLVHIPNGVTPDRVEVDTPAGAVTIAQPGTYRVDMDPANLEARITVRVGLADVALEGETIPVGPGKELLLTAGEAPSYRMSMASAPDSLDRWAEGRDRGTDHSDAVGRLGSDIIGAAELDGAGTWRTVPAFGNVWAPTTAQGWVPYRDGRWTWVDPWGWTWVDAAPWGFATTHYGRWAALDGAWVWVPPCVAGSRRRPPYAPALVAFVGQPTHVRLGERAPMGGVAWFPLGPREPYTPTFPVSRSRFLAFNEGVAAMGARPKSWANLTVPGAVTAVPRNAFQTFAPIAPVAMAVNGRDFRSASVGGGPALAPTLHSVRADADREMTAHMGSGLKRRALLAKTPLPTTAVPFQARMGSIQANHGRPMGAASVGTLRGNGGASNLRMWRSVDTRNGRIAPQNRSFTSAPPVRSQPPSASPRPAGGPRPVPRPVGRGMVRKDRPAVGSGKSLRQQQRPQGALPHRSEGARPGHGTPADRPKGGGGQPKQGDHKGPAKEGVHR